MNAEQWITGSSASTRFPRPGSAGVCQVSATDTHEQCGRSSTTANILLSPRGEIFSFGYYVVQFLNYNLVLFQNFHFSPKICVSLPLNSLCVYASMCVKVLVYYSHSSNWVLCGAAHSYVFPCFTAFLITLLFC